MLKRKFRKPAPTLPEGQAGQESWEEAPSLSALESQELDYALLQNISSRQLYLQQKS